MEKETIIQNIKNALGDLYLREADLITNKTEEETISAHLMYYLKSRFEGWSVDVEYNRDGRDTKNGSNGKPIYPDISIHHRTPDRVNKFSPKNNLVTIEVKGYWNKENRSNDEKKLRDRKSIFGYQYLFRIELGKDTGELIEV